MFHNKLEIYYRLKHLPIHMIINRDIYGKLDIRFRNMYNLP